MPRSSRAHRAMRLPRARALLENGDCRGRHRAQTMAASEDDALAPAIVLTARACRQAAMMTGQLGSASSISAADQAVPRR
jgi:hypothetical protein